jgi:hypothetical protein
MAAPSARTDAAWRFKAWSLRSSVFQNAPCPFFASPQRGSSQRNLGHGDNPLSSTPSAAAQMLDLTNGVTAKVRVG